MCDAIPGLIPVDNAGWCTHTAVRAGQAVIPQPQSIPSREFYCLPLKLTPWIRVVRVMGFCRLSPVL